MAESVQYTSEPEPIQYMPLPDGRADVWLRQSITQETRETENGTETIWTAHEVYFHTSLTESEVAENFDAIWENGGVIVDEDAKEEVADGVTLKERVEANEEAIAELADIIAELAG